MFNRIYEDRQEFIKTMTSNIEMIILQRQNLEEAEALDRRIEELKNELKRLIRFQVNNGVDAEVIMRSTKAYLENWREFGRKGLSMIKLMNRRMD